MTISSSIISATAARRLLSRLVVVLALTVIGAIMAGALIIMAFYGFYCGLIALGATTGPAVILLLLLAVACLAGMGVVIQKEMNGLKQSLPRNVSDYVPNMSSIMTTIEAFVAGLAGRKRG